MTARVLKGSKDEIARELAKIEGEVRQAIIFVEEPVESKPSDADAPPADAPVEDIFAEMEAYTVKVGQVDDSREAIYQRMEGE